MKKLYLMFCLISFVASNALSQGNVNANNAGSGILLQVRNTDLNGGALVTAGTPASNAGYLGVGPGQITIEMFAAPDGTPLSTLESSSPILIASNVNSTVSQAQGFLNAGNPLKLPNSPAFNGSFPIEVIFFGVSANGDYSGWSSEGTGIIPALGPNPAPAIFGTASGLINQFIIENSPEVVATPEPTTIALGLFGAASLVVFRRKK